MKKQAFANFANKLALAMLFALALAFVFAPSLEAQTTFNWNGRTLIGWEMIASSQNFIRIEKAKFGTLYGGGNSNVVE